uniref:Ubiquitin carboxyl-terminal hydrolase n=1 Tax=Sphenodon punctatus TaxID=8508 RepID=A0A8D0GIV5_SPHPU
PPFFPTQSPCPGGGGQGKGSAPPSLMKNTRCGLPARAPGSGRSPRGAQPGMKNHGNTCFINAVVQCLSHTEPLAEHLLLPPGPGTRPGPRGEVTRHLAALLRALWTRHYTPQLSLDFKNIVSKYGTQFRGNSQHDALEFLLWLLDRMHEDLGGSSPSQKERASGKVSLTAPLAPRGQSFVQSHFQAQYRSSLTCPHCQKQSNTFDPFLCISLPIPLRQTRPLNVTLVFQSKSHRFLRVGLAVPLLSTVATLREMVAEEGKIPPYQVILAEVYATGFQRSFSDEEDLDAIAEGDSVYAFQAPPPIPRGNSSRLSGEFWFVNPPSPFLHHGGGSRVLLLVCNTAGAGQQAVRFGPPLLMREDRAMSWDQLQQCILGKMRYLMKREEQVQSAGGLFRVRVAGVSVPCSYLSPQDSRPLCHPAVDRRERQGTGPPGAALSIWSCLFGSIQEEVVQDADSVRLQQQLHQQPPSCSLAECFQLYTKEEQLAPDDAWRCPHCQVLQQGTVKMSLWTLPDILVLHLKRFRQAGERRHKLSTLVRFPLCGLDMAPHVAKRGHGSKWEPWKGPPGLPDGSGGQVDFLYDLYAVCNHHGSLQGGHYTGECAIACVCVLTLWVSLAGSTSSSVSEHWLARLGGSSSTTCLSLPKTTDSSPQADASLEKGGFETRPLVRGVRGRSVSLKVSPSKAKLAVPKPVPLRWSFASRERPQGVSGQLVEYLESGRRPRFTSESIVPLMTAAVEENEPTANSTVTRKGQEADGTVAGSVERHSKALPTTEKPRSLKRVGRPKESTGQPPRTPRKLALPLTMAPPVGGEGPKSQTSANRALRDRNSLPQAGCFPKFRGGPGRSGDHDQRAHGRGGGREADGERQQEGKLAILRASFLRKEPKRHSAAADRNAAWELSMRCSGASLSNGTLSGGEGRANGRICRSELDIKRAQSSCSLLGKGEWALNRSASLCKSSSGGPAAPDTAFCGTLQRVRYHTASLGRRKPVPESSF